MQSTLRHALWVGSPVYTVSTVTGRVRSTILKDGMDDKPYEAVRVLTTFPQRTSGTLRALFAPRRSQTGTCGQSSARHP